MKISHFLNSLVIAMVNSKARKIKTNKLSYLTYGALNNIHKAVKKVEQNKVEGIFIEAGCALGGSTIMIGQTKAQSRPLYVYDTFGQIPPPTEHDGSDIHSRYKKIKSGNSKGIKNDPYYGYEKNLLEKVRHNLKRFDLTQKDQISLIKGLFKDTLKIKNPVAFAHIDCDWYDSVMNCLEQIEPRISRGGILIIDDYYDWSGCRSAVDTYFKRENNAAAYTFTTKHQKLILTRK